MSGLLAGPRAHPAAPSLLRPRSCRAEDGRQCDEALLVPDRGGGVPSERELPAGPLRPAVRWSRRVAGHERGHPIRARRTRHCATMPAEEVPERCTVGACSRSTTASTPSVSAAVEDVTGRVTERTGHPSPGTPGKGSAHSSPHRSGPRPPATTARPPGGTRRPRAPDRVASRPGGRETSTAPGCPFDRTPRLRVTVAGTGSAAPLPSASCRPFPRSAPCVPIPPSSRVGRLTDQDTTRARPPRPMAAYTKVKPASSSSAGQTPSWPAATATSRWAPSALRTSATSRTSRRPRPRRRRPGGTATRTNSAVPARVHP